MRILSKGWTLLLLAVLALAGGSSAARAEPPLFARTAQFQFIEFYSPM